MKSTSVLPSLWVVLGACTAPAPSSPGPGRPGAPAPAGIGAPPITVALAPAAKLAPETPQNCARLRKAISFWDKAQAAYQTLLPRAKQERWTGKQYNEEVEKLVAAQLAREPAEEPVPGGGPLPRQPAGPHTDPCTCEPKNIDENCAWYRDNGFPDVMCDVTRAHEQVHVGQCELNRTLADGDPRKYRCEGQPPKSLETQEQRNAWEQAAYDAILPMLYSAYYDRCGTCQTLAKAKAWAAAINVQYTRTNTASAFQEQLSGSAGYTAQLTAPRVGASVGGYSKLWMGPAVGRARFEEVETTGRGAPYTGRGDGPLVKEPPLGRFTAEILRIDPVTCVYAFETSAAISSEWSDGIARIDGTHVQLGGLPIEDGVKTLAGTKTIALPVSHFDWPGPAATLPNEPVDWKARGRIAGSITVSWSFTPIR